MALFLIRRLPDFSLCSAKSSWLDSSLGVASFVRGGFIARELNVDSALCIFYGARVTDVPYIYIYRIP